MEQNICDDSLLNGVENATGEENGNSDEVPSCSNCSSLALKVKRLNAQFLSLRESVLQTTNAVKRLAVRNSNKILHCGINEFKQILDKTGQSSTEGSSNCCDTLVRQEKTLLLDLAYIRKEIVERTTTLVTLAEDDNDLLLKVFITKVKKIAEEIRNGNDGATTSKRIKLGNEAENKHSSPAVDISTNNPGSSNIINSTVVNSSTLSKPLHKAKTIGELLFSDEKVIRKLVQCINFSDRKSARGVNSFWNSICCQVLLDEDSSVLIHCDTKTNIFRQSTWLEYNGESGRPKVYSPRPLSALNELIKGAKDGFPCATFAFVSGDLSSQQVKTFFQLQGDKIQHLFLKGDPKLQTSKSTLKKLLEVSVPNLKTLEIRFLEYSWKKSESVQLPFLEYLCFARCYATAKAIIRGSPKLEEIVDPIGDYNSVKALVDCGKIHLVKKVQCDEDTKIKSFTTFSFPVPPDETQLENLGFVVDKKFTKYPADRKNQMAASFNKLIVQNKDTLEDLILSGLIPCNDIQFPVMTKLESLDLDWELCPSASPCFPIGIDLSMTFPSLHILDCGTLHSRKDSEWETHFPQSSLTGNLPSVETLCISDECSVIWMSKLHDLCCNFKTLVVWSEFEGKQDFVLPKIFKLYTHLECMELKIYRIGPNAGKRPFNMDSAFTGLSEEVCSKLLQNSDLSFDGHFIEPSLTDLPDLKYLSINLTGCAHLELAREITKSVPITWVSGKFAFQKIPSLKVSIKYDQNCPHNEIIKTGLDSVAPYVNFDHHHDYKNNKISKSRKQP